jgi:hypothetical protein
MGKTNRKENGIACAGFPIDAKKKRPAFPAERFCVAQRMR